MFKPSDIEHFCPQHTEVWAGGSTLLFSPDEVTVFAASHPETPIQHFIKEDELGWVEIEELAEEPDGEPEGDENKPTEGGPTEDPEGDEDEGQSGQPE